MFTVEMAILFPVIFLTLIGLMYMAIMQYQNITTQTAAMRTASRVAYTWSALGRENAWDENGQLTAFDYTEHDPYAAVADGKKSIREQNGLAYFNQLSGENPNLLGEGNETTANAAVNKEFHFLQSYVNVSVDKHYVNPLGHLAERLGIASESDRKVTATAPVNDATEFVRLVGLIYDVATELTS